MQDTLNRLLSRILYLDHWKIDIHTFSNDKSTIFHQINDPDIAIVVKKATSNLRHVAALRQSSRNDIVRCLLSCLGETAPFRVYRMDVTKFYESISLGELETAIRSLHRLHGPSQTLLLAVLSEMKKTSGTGLFRGLGCSAAFSELVMKPFDDTLRSNSHVYFYARYVDDIIVVTNGLERVDSFRDFVETILPTGLRLNEKKTIILDCTDKQTDAQLLNYLGYRITIPSLASSRHTARTLLIEISDQKLKKIKTRIARSFQEFRRHGDWPLFWSRLRYLASNYLVRDTTTGAVRLSGIYYSYPLSSSTSIRLQQLDHFLHAHLFRANTNLSSCLANLRGEQRRKILGLSFVTGFQSRRIIRITAEQFAEIKECWRNVK